VVTSGPSRAARNRNPNPENLPKFKRKSNGEDSKPAIEVITGFGVELTEPEGAKPSPLQSAVITDPAKPANGMTTGSKPESAAMNRNPNPETFLIRGRATAKIQNRP